MRNVFYQQRPEIIFVCKCLIFYGLIISGRKKKKKTDSTAQIYRLFEFHHGPSQKILDKQLTLFPSIGVTSQQHIESNDL